MPKRILIVGGCVPLIETAVDTLQEKGYSFTQLDTIVRALETVTRRFFPLVVIDIPGIDPALVTRSFKDITPLATIIVLAAPGATPVLPLAATEAEAVECIDRDEPFAITGALSLERLALLVEEHRKVKKQHSSHTVLFVDDNASVLQSYIPILEDEGYAVTGVGSGREAIDAMRRNYYGIVILDYKLPDMSGLDISRRLRQIDTEAALIFMTAFADLDIVIEALKEQASDFLIKPIDPEKLCVTLKKTSALLK